MRQCFFGGAPRFWVRRGNINSLLYCANVACLSSSLSPLALCILSGFDVFELGSVTEAQKEGLLFPGSNR